MRTDVPAYETSPRSVVDARLTRVGRLIRRLSFDEMPQLINVLKGEMSMVGPRPEMPFIGARYHPIECERLVARPGITGLWQISPARAFPIHENLQYDLHYIRNQNFFLDFAIVLRTIVAVIHGVGAI
jgi:lipopolysaccharide/colanic/teichoic acid biosynthesis glycosyltransferase